jgi:hypothetical protein
MDAVVRFNRVAARDYYIEMVGIHKLSKDTHSPPPNCSGTTSEDGNESLGVSPWISAHIDENFVE